MQFTPEAFPALSPEMCAFLNTPLEACDPDIVLFLFSGLVDYLTALPEGADTPDPMEVFATLWARLGEVRGDAAANGPPATEGADAAPVVPVEALPAVPAASPNLPPGMPLPPPASAPSPLLPETLPGLPPASSDPSSGAQAKALSPALAAASANVPAASQSHLPAAQDADHDDAAVIAATAACKTRPAAAFRHGRELRGCPLFGPAQSLRQVKSLRHTSGLGFNSGDRRGGTRRAMSNCIRRQSPPARQCCYAARASPF